MYPHINRGEGQFIAMLQKTTETAISKEKILKTKFKERTATTCQSFIKKT